MGDDEELKACEAFFFSKGQYGGCRDGECVGGASVRIVAKDDLREFAENSTRFVSSTIRPAIAVLSAGVAKH